MEIVTPDQIISQLTALRAEAEKGIEAQYQAERDLAIKQSEAEKIEAAAFLRMKGLVGERQAIAKLESAEAKLDADLAKAVFNYAMYSALIFVPVGIALKYLHL